VPPLWNGKTEYNTSISILCESSYCCPHKNALEISKKYLTSVNPSFASTDLNSRTWREGMGGSRSRMGDWSESLGWGLGRA